jgi:hypothetical protein
MLAGVIRDHGTWDAAVVSRSIAAGVSWQRRGFCPLRVTDTMPSPATTNTSRKPAMPPVRVTVKGKTAGWL